MIRRLAACGKTPRTLLAGGGWRRAAVALALLAALGGCKDAAPPEEKPGAPGTGVSTAEPPAFVWTAHEPRSLDPSLLSDLTASVLVLDLFEGLLVNAPDDGPPRSGVAERWEPTPDHRVWTFHLRKSARWSDGQPVVAGDFVYAFRRMLDPATGAPGAEDLWLLKNGQAFNEGKLTDPTSIGAKALGDHVLEVTLERPDPLFARHVTTSRCLPLPQRAVEAHGAAWTRPEHIVTNGAFRLVEWAPREHIRLRRDPDYWNVAEIALPSAELRFSASESLVMRWYEAGEVHYTPSQVPFETIVALQRAGRKDLRLDPLLGVAYLVFDVREAPFDDARVRRAFDQAVDKTALIRATLRGGQQPATHLLPERYAAYAGYEGPRGPGFDPAAAAGLLAEAGFPGGTGFPEVRLVCNTSEVLARMATFLQSQWAAHLGVTVRVEQQEWKSYLARVRAGDFELARFAMQGGVDPADLLHVARSGAGNNLGGYANPRYDAALARAGEEPDRARRLAHIAECETILVEDRPLLPLYFYTVPALLSPRVRGFAAESRGVHLLRYLSMAPPAAATP